LFIAVADMNFYFLVLNTILQVVHSASVLVTGQALVELMIRVAAGEQLPLVQDDVTLTGWAMESRVYAEDPFRNFMPSTGRLVRYAEPQGEGVRVDSGVYEGGEVSMFYDPMIAKLITYGEDRITAIDRMVEALGRFEIAGLGHNIDFLSALMQHERFRSGNITTNFIAEEYPDGFQGAPADHAQLRRLAAIGGFVATAHADRNLLIDGQLGHRLQPPSQWQVKIADDVFDVTVSRDDVSVNGEGTGLSMAYSPGDRMVEAEFGEDVIVVAVRPTRAGFRFNSLGASHDLRVLPAHAAQHAQHMIEKIPPDTSKLLLCPMPGLLVSLHVGEGDKVEPGQPLATVEAMKMENILRAEKAGTIATINTAEGDSLAVDEVILELE